VHRDTENISNKQNTQNKHKKEKQTTMNVISNISKVVRTLGVLGIMLALAGFAVSSAPSASAASLSPRTEAGTLAVSVDFGYTAADNNVATVTVLNQDGKIVSQGTVDSETIFVTKLAPAAYAVSVEAKAFKSYSTKVMITSGQTSSVKATLETDKGVPATSAASDSVTGSEMGGISLQVAFPASASDSNIATVVVQNRAGKLISKGSTKSDGSYEIELAPDTYKVTVTADGYKPYTQTVKIASNLTVEVQIALQSGRSRQ
jgi:hypothetical protein